MDSCKITSKCRFFKTFIGTKKKGNILWLCSIFTSSRKRCGTTKAIFCNNVESVTNSLEVPTTCRLRTCNKISTLLQHWFVSHVGFLLKWRLCQRKIFFLALKCLLSEMWIVLYRPWKKRVQKHKLIKILYMPPNAESLNYQLLFALHEKKRTKKHRKN